MPGTRGRLARAVSAASLIYILMLLALTPAPAGASAEFVGVDTGILSSAYKTIDEPSNSFQVQVKPYLYNNDGEFDATYIVEVPWDGNAVVAAYLPAVLEIYEYVNQTNDEDKIVALRPTLMGLSAVVRGSHKTGYDGAVFWWEDYRIQEGYLYASLQYTLPAEHSYEVYVYVSQYEEVNVAFEAWAVARAELSAGFKLLDLISASLTLAEIELGVSTEIQLVERFAQGYIYKVTFTTTTADIIFNYVVNATFHYIYGEIVDPLGNMQPASYGDLIDRYELLSAVGSYSASTDVIAITPFTSFAEFDGGDSTGMLVFESAE